MAITDISTLGNITIEFSEPVQSLEKLNKALSKGRRLSAGLELNLTSLKNLDIIEVIYSTTALDDEDQPISKMLDWNVVDFNSTHMVIHSEFENPLKVSSTDSADLIFVKIKKPHFFISDDGERMVSEDIPSLSMPIPR